MFGRTFDRTTQVFIVIAALAAVACYMLRGPDETLDALRNAFDLMIFIIPQLAAGLLLGGLVQVLLSRERISRALGARSRLRGLVIATGAGMITPEGPFTSFPLVFALWKAGADIGALVTYLTAWALIGINRILIWEVPFMGVEFALLRLAVCLPLPLVCGLIARQVSRRTGLARDRGEATP